LLDDLSPPSNRPHPSKDLDLLREEIDPLDQNLLEILGERMNIVKKIALDKKKHKKNPLQKQRIENLIQSRIMSGAQLGLKEEYIRNIYQVIHNESVARQSEIINATKMI
jgi:chorismate mutase